MLAAVVATAVGQLPPGTEHFGMLNNSATHADVNQIEAYFCKTSIDFYYLTDYQGNNIAVVDAGGAITQRTDYYPYGEPWRYPNGQQYLYSDKELTRADGRHAYTFPARTLLPSFP